MSAMVTTKIAIETHNHVCPHMWNLNARSDPNTTISRIEMYIGTVVRPESWTIDMMRARSRSFRMPKSTAPDAPWVPSSASTEAMCRKSNQFKVVIVLIARRIPAPPPGGEPLERLEPGTHEHRARLALFDAAVQQLVEQPDHCELLPARRAVPERGVERRLAVGARGQTNLPAGLDPVVDKRVDEALAVVPLDVLGLVDVPRGLVHAGLAGVKHVLQVVRQQRPLVEMVLAAFLAGDHDSLDALREKDRVHLREVGEVRLDIGALILADLIRLFG